MVPKSSSLCAVPRPLPLVLGLLALALSAEARAERMTFLHTPPASAQAGKPLELVGNIFGAGDLAKARCRYRQRGTSWKQVELALEYGDLYRAIIPARDVTAPGVEYYCVAIDFFGAQTELFASISAPKRVRVTGEYRPADDGEGEEGEGEEDPKPAKQTKGKPGKGPTKLGDDGDEGDLDLAGGDSGEKGKAGDGGKPGAGGDKVKDGKGKDGKRPDPGDEEPADEGEPDDGEPRRRASSEDDELALFGAEDVVTLATRQAQSVSDAPAIASGVPEEQMRALGLRSLPEVLKILPGFETSRDVQGFHRLAIRGMRDDAALLVLYDGHRLNNAYDAKALLNLPTENAERVEVIRGPGSALYGTGAFLGVVNVVTRRRETVEASLSGGSFGTVDGHLTAGRKFGDLGLYTDADVAYTDGYRQPIQRDALSTQMEKLGKKSEDQPAGLTNDFRRFANVGGEARWAPADSGTTRLAARYMYEDRGALVGAFDVLGRDSELLWQVLMADLSHEVPLNPGTFSAKLSFDHQAVDRLFQIAPPGYQLGTNVAPTGLFERTAFTSQTVGLESALDLSIAQSHKLSVGLSGSYQRLPTYSYQLNFSGSEIYPSELVEPKGFSNRQAMPELKTRLEGGVFAQDVWRALPSLSVTVGLRLDVTRLPQVVLDEKGAVTAIAGTRYVPSIDPRVGVVFSPGEGWNAKLLYGRAFRAPTIQELAEKIPTTDLSAGRFEGNPGLTPATIDTLEAGLETATAVGENKVRLRGNGFFNNFSDPIMAIDTSGNVIPLSNRKLGVRVWGAEAEVRFEISSRAYTFFNYSWFRATDLAAPEGFGYLTDVPQYRFNWAAQLPLGRSLDLAILAQTGAERRNNARSQLEAMRRFSIPAYALVGAQLRTETLADHYDFALTAQNVFQYDLKDDVPRPDPTRMPGMLPREGFGAFLTARAHF